MSPRAAFGLRSWLSGLAALAGTAAASLVPRGRIHYVDVPTVQLSLRRHRRCRRVRVRATRARHAGLAASRPREIGLPAPRRPGPGRARRGRHPAAHRRGRPDRAAPLRAPSGGRLRPALRRADRHRARPRRTDDAAGPGLPALVGLSFSPYADAAGWQARARRQGHEVLLDLPLEPARYPQDDSGPLTVPTSPAGLEPARCRASGRGCGYVALTADAGAFSGDDAAFAPVARLLRRARPGLGRAGRRRAGASRAGRGLALCRGRCGPVDADLSAEAVIAGAGRDRGRGAAGRRRPGLRPADAGRAGPARRVARDAAGQRAPAGPAEPPPRRPAAAACARWGMRP